MAFTFIVKECSESGYSTSASGIGSNQRVVTNLETSYLVKAVAGSPSDTPDKLSDAVIGCLSSIPQAGISTYYHNGSNTAAPRAVCNSVNISRDTGNRLLFRVKATWTTEPLSAPICLGVPPATLADLSPTVEARIEQSERVLYEDLDGNNSWILPNGNPYAAPVMTRVPLLHLTITQYESAITYEQMLARSFVVNSDVYRTQAAGRWMTGPVQAGDVVVNIGGVNTTVAKVTYPVMLADFNYVAGGQDVGWKASQPLMDTAYLTAGGELTPFVTAGTQANYVGYINASGQKDATKNLGDAPNYILHRTQTSAIFNAAGGGFLQI